MKTTKSCGGSGEVEDAKLLGKLEKNLIQEKSLVGEEDEKYLVSMLTGMSHGGLLIQKHIRNYYIHYSVVESEIQELEAAYSSDNKENSTWRKGYLQACKDLKRGLLEKKEVKK